MILAHIIATVLATIFTLQQGDQVICQPDYTGSGGRVMMAPAPAPTPTSCIAIAAPRSDATLSGMVAISIMNNCVGAYFETLIIDGASAGVFPLGTISFDTTKISNGVHQFQVTSQSMNPGSRALGSDSTNYSVQN